MCKNDPYYEVSENIPIENLERDIPDIHLDRFVKHCMIQYW